MGYDLHITKKENWYDETGDTISLQAFHQLASDDPELMLCSETCAFIVLGTEMPPIDANAEGLDRYRHFTPENACYAIYHERDEIRIPRAANVTIPKLMAIAKQLNAKLQGDDGETYDRPDYPYYDQVVNDNSLLYKKETNPPVNQVLPAQPKNKNNQLGWILGAVFFLGLLYKWITLSSVH
jgi:hypothetical protein